jgi:hypothetical protein
MELDAVGLTLSDAVAKPAVFVNNRGFVSFKTLPMVSGQCRHNPLNNLRQIQLTTYIKQVCIQFEENPT